ncbi:hypothetical protein [Streptomyces sp. AK02-01A]|uniref:hypothetical protein n=1 Tax=Streptomyces sp. AK02-01A TaxID=3028648 RepID=UPI0029BDF146|nr:hypothetical protein [Streptomyces sp. AK02-01A]MDX3855653.1 hypothetical protein [Streptomyces sp. AK02-01A]
MSTDHPGDRAVHDPALQQLAAFIRESEQILADWDTYSDQHTDLDGWPHDGYAYGMRAQRRDADTWRAFTRVRSSAKDMLATAETQMRRLPATAIQPRWTYQLGRLHSALERLTELRDDWLATRDSLPPSAEPGSAEYDDARAERNGEAWSYLDEWASAGDVLLEIHRAAEHIPPTPPAHEPVSTPAPPPPAGHSAAAKR